MNIDEQYPHRQISESSFLRMFFSFRADRRMSVGPGQPSDCVEGGGGCAPSFHGRDMAGSATPVTAQVQWAWTGQSPVTTHFPVRDGYY